jgi:hypothetical protein
MAATGGSVHALPDPPRKLPRFIEKLQMEKVMPEQTRDAIFISYSRKDEATYREVKQCLLDQGLGSSLCDDNDVRPSEKWDPRIQAMMDRAAVAVLILSNHYFRRREEGPDYILEDSVRSRRRHGVWNPMSRPTPTRCKSSSTAAEWGRIPGPWAWPGT